MTRNELLEQLFDRYWNKTNVLESDLPQYGLVPNADLAELDSICEQIEALS